MAADPIDFTTIAAVKLHLGVTVATDDAILQSWVTGASAWLLSVLSRPIKTASYTETKNGGGGDRIWLRNGPVTGITSLKIDGLTIPAATVGGTDSGWLWNNEDDQVLALRGYTFTRARSNVVVAYVAGFAAVPADIERACVSIVAWRYKEKDRIGHASKTAGTETVAFQTTATAADVKVLLDQYRRVVPA